MRRDDAIVADLHVLRAVGNDEVIQVVDEKGLRK